MRLAVSLLVLLLTASAHAGERSFSLGALLGLFQSNDPEALAVGGDGGGALVGRLAVLSSDRQAALRGDLSLSALLGHGHVGVAYGSVGVEASAVAYVWNLRDKLGSDRVRFGWELRLGVAGWAENDDRQGWVLTIGSGPVAEIGSHSWIRLEVLVETHPHEQPTGSSAGAARDPRALGFLGAGVTVERAF